MLTRDELLVAIDAIGEKDVLTIREITDTLSEGSTHTVSGWVSNERDFPVAERGARNQKHYNKDTFIKLSLYVYAMRLNGGVKISGPTAIQRLNEANPREVLELLREAESKFLQFFLPRAA